MLSWQSARLGEGPSNVLTFQLELGYAVGFGKVLVSISVGLLIKSSHKIAATAQSY